MARIERNEEFLRGWGGKRLRYGTEYLMSKGHKKAYIYTYIYMQLTRYGGGINCCCCISISYFTDKAWPAWLALRPGLGSSTEWKDYWNMIAFLLLLPFAVYSVSLKWWSAV